MRKISLFLALILISFGFCDLPAMAQSSSTNVFTNLMNKKKIASMQSQTVTTTDAQRAANKAAYDDAMQKATISNQQASQAMMQAHAAESARKAQELEAMFAAERAKYAAANNPNGVPAQQGGTDENGQPKKVYKAPANAIRVYTPKKGTGDQPRRLFNVREQ